MSDSIQMTVAAAVIADTFVEKYGHQVRCHAGGWLPHIEGELTGLTELMGSDEVRFCLAEIVQEFFALTAPVMSQRPDVSHRVTLELYELALTILEKRLKYIEE